MDSRNLSQQLFIHLLHMLVMGNVVISHRHLSTTYTCADIAHPVVVTNLLVLVVGIAFTVLRDVHHNFPPFLLIIGNQCTAT